MKLYTLGLSLAVLVLATTSFCQTAPQEVSELLKRYNERLRHEILLPHELAVADLNAKLVAALNRAQETAQKKGDLKESVALKTEKDAVLAGGYAPDVQDNAAPPSLRIMRAAYRTSVKALELERDRRMRPQKDAFAKTLQTLITKMTKDGKLDEAVALKKIRDDLVNNDALPSSAVSGGPFVNSLGMKFVPVPGTSILMCIHETRKGDYAAYAMANPSVDSSWQKVSVYGLQVSTDDDHPVANLSWVDANDFCAWLSKKEGRAYRLPTDREWSYAVGIGRNEAKGVAPSTLGGSVTEEFLWGKSWPPAKNNGNYADMSLKEKAPDRPVIEGYNDGYATTSPVMSYSPNKLGIYDLGGNLWEWCEDWYSSDQQARVLRGGGWSTPEQNQLRASSRFQMVPELRRWMAGFRCVLEDRTKDVSTSGTSSDLDADLARKWSYHTEPDGAAKGWVNLLNGGRVEFTGLNKNARTGEWEKTVTLGTWARGKKLNELIVSFPDYSWEVRIENGIGKIKLGIGTRYLKPVP
jgi:hypothetical protein